MIYSFYEDPGHGWLKVPAALLGKLGIANLISSYSYIRGDYVYLEEDCDAPLFLKEAALAGLSVKIKRFFSNKSSKIRSYNNYDTPVFCGK